MRGDYEAWLARALQRMWGHQFGGQPQSRRRSALCSIVVSRNSKPQRNPERWRSRTRIQTWSPTPCGFIPSMATDAATASCGKTMLIPPVLMSAVRAWRMTGTGVASANRMRMSARRRGDTRRRHEPATGEYELTVFLRAIIRPRILQFVERPTCVLGDGGIFILRQFAQPWNEF